LNRQFVAVLGDPAKSQAIAQAYNMIGTARDVSGIIADVLAFRPSVLDERKPEITAIVKSLFEAREFAISNREEAMEIMPKRTKIPREALEASIVGTLMEAG